MEHKLTVIEKNKLKALCTEHSFVQHGNTFFRLWGQDILQAVSFHYQRVFSHYSLEIGLMSMYNEPHDLLFHRSSIVPRYSICCLNNQPHAISSVLVDGYNSTVIASPDEQLDILEKKGFEWFDGINNQERLLLSIFELDRAYHQSIIWNDMYKLAPYLAIGDYHGAKDIISSILNQHLGRDSFAKPPWTDQDFMYYSQHLLYEDEDKELFRIYQWIQEKNEQAIKEYLFQNKEKNLQCGRFLTKGRR